MNKYKQSDITLYVPCHNADGTIGACLAGVAAQSAAPAAVILVDDGSTSPLTVPDNTPVPQNLKIIRHPANAGLGAARNTALHACQTALIAAVDADIMPAPDWLAHLLEAINTENAAGAGGMVHEHYQDTLGDRWRAVHMAQHWGAAPVRNPRFLYGANTLFQSDALRNAGGYDATLRTNNEDRTMCDAMRARGLTLFYTPAAQCRHLRRDTSRTILPGYWRWNHAAGLAAGEFDAPAGLLTRIDRVNFGIFRYRFDLDVKAGRTELLGLDAALPWVFCAQDILFYHQRSSADAPAFPPPALLNQLPENIATALRKLLPTGTPLPKAPPSWYTDYLAIFHKSLEHSGWLRNCPDQAIWRTVAER